MPPKRGRRSVTPRRNPIEDASSARQDETVATAAQATSMAAMREELMQEILAMMTELLQRKQNVPPPQAPPPVQTHHPSPPMAAMPTPGNDLTYWEPLKLLKDMNMDTFTGGTDPVKANDWRKLLERKLESFRCPTDFKKELAVNYLHGEALIWWESVERSMPFGYEISWENFREEFNKKYFPQEALDSLESAFLDLHQGTKIVRDYEREFNRLRRFVVSEPGEQTTIRRFMRGLKPEIRNHCSIREYNNMIELVKKAAMMEDRIKEESRNRRNAQVKAMKVAEPLKRTWDNHGAGISQVKLPQCTKCGRNHGGTCWKESDKCFQC